MSFLRTGQHREHIQLRRMLNQCRMPDIKSTPFPETSSDVEVPALLQFGKFSYGQGVVFTKCWFEKKLKKITPPTYTRARTPTKYNRYSTTDVSLERREPLLFQALRYQGE